MKKLKILSVFALIGIFLFAACEQEDINPNINKTQHVEEIHQKSEKQIKNNNPCIPDNTINPYDYAGVSHNSILTKLEGIVDNNDSLARVIHINDSLIIDELGMSVSPMLLNQTQLEALIQEVQADYYLSEVNNLNLSSLQKTKLTELFNIGIQYENEPLCDVIDNIKIFEDQLLIDYNEDDIKVVLVCSSIMRYSLYYWSDHVQRDKAFWKKLVVAVCDVAGGVAGATAGSPTGVFAVAGAIAGAAGASGAAAGVITFFENH